MRVWRFEHAKRQSNSSTNSAAGASRSANTVYRRSLTRHAVSRQGLGPTPVSGTFFFCDRPRRYV